jgi:hypothetical protein
VSRGTEYRARSKSPPSPGGIVDGTKKWQMANGKWQNWDSGTLGATAIRVGGLEFETQGRNAAGA